MKNIDYDDEILDDNNEIAEDIESFNPSDIVVYSRDWTIETIFGQIKQGNIDLNPKFQRRNAWTDEKRSKLIESIIIGYPVPEIVLAEDPNKKRSFIVIDGKQRLLTISGFIDDDSFDYWVKPKLNKLKIRKDLNALSYLDMKNDPKYSDELREFQNSSLRCTIITNYTTNDVLYDIFYRLNSGSVPLSTQELRQVLNRGEFANYLIQITDKEQPIHKVLKLDGPDKRLRDIEILLRVLSFYMYPSDYTGNLKKFLDDKMGYVTDNWQALEDDVRDAYSKINKCIEYLNQTFGGYEKIGRKVTEGSFESRFNRVIFEVQLFYFLNIDLQALSDSAEFVKEFKELCSKDYDFRSSIESSTKNIENYQIRYSKFQELINDSFGFEIDINPFPIPSNDDL